MEFATDTKRARVNTRARLIQAAYEVFAEAGFQSATIEQVCERAGFTRGAFYSNFETKDDLFMALFETHAERLLEEIRAVVATAPEDDAITHMASFFSDYGEDNRAWFMLSMEFTLHAIRNPVAAELLAEQDRKLREAMTPLIEKAIERSGRKPLLPADTLARGLVALTEGASAQSYVEPDQLPPGSLERTLLPFIFLGVTE